MSFKCLSIQLAEAFKSGFRGKTLTGQEAANLQDTMRASLPAEGFQNLSEEELRAREAEAMRSNSISGRELLKTDPESLTPEQRSQFNYIKNLEQQGLSPEEIRKAIDEGVKAQKEKVQSYKDTVGNRPQLQSSNKMQKQSASAKTTTGFGRG